MALALYIILASLHHCLPSAVSRADNVVIPGGADSPDVDRPVTHFPKPRDSTPAGVLRRRRRRRDSTAWRDEQGSGQFGKFINFNILNKDLV